jgi:hypothetical protein
MEKFNHTPTKSRPTDPRRLKHKVNLTSTLTDSVKGGSTKPALEATKKKKGATAHCSPAGRKH